MLLSHIYSTFCFNVYDFFEGKNIDVKKLKQGHHNQPCFVVFDILYLNDKVLTNVILEERFKILEDIIRPEEGVLVLSPKDVVTTRYSFCN